MPRIPRKPLSEIDLQSIHSFALSFEEEESFQKGLFLFNAGRFWEAHEAWEEIWLARPEDGRFFIQGLIQLAAAYHQYRRQIFRGFVTHLKRAEEKIRLFPSNFLGVDVATLLKEIQETQAVVRKLSAQEPARCPELTIPKIACLED